MRKKSACVVQFIAPLAVARFNQEAAVINGIIRAQLEQEGQPIGLMDLLIAAHARSLDVRLVTNNESEFKRVPGLRIENWVS
jgi:tRNA(fMet)-specific endonuclease VapC